MIQVEKIDTRSKNDVNRFVQFHYDLYKGCPQWVPPFYSDIKTMLNRDKHPFYEHSDADFFIATRGKDIVGRIGVLDNKSYNDYHKSRQAVFYLFDTVNDLEVSSALFDRASDWARQRGLDTLIGPKGLSPFDGYGIQIEGFDKRQMMIMMNYNYDYYPVLMDQMGFRKEVDFVSCYINWQTFKLPDVTFEISRRIQEKGNFTVQRFPNKNELMKWATRIGESYNRTFINNWEYYPLTPREIKFTVDNILSIADPHLIKIILYKGEVAGFLFAFADVSAALQRQKGHITPWGIADILIDMKRTKWVSLNGVGILPQFQGRGGNALLYTEMLDTLKGYDFQHAELTQMAETAVAVRQEFARVGAEPYKNHRIYRKTL